MWLCLVLAGCAAHVGDGEGADGSGIAAGEVAEAEKGFVVPLPFALPVDQPVEPGTYADLMGWLIDRSYESWASESEVHRSALGPAGVRIFINPVLAESMAAGAMEHPLGAMAIRELYEEDLETLEGFAVAIKTGNSAEDPAQQWFWFEVFGVEPESEPIIAEFAAPGCSACHSEGVDFIHSSYPLL